MTSTKLLKVEQVVARHHKKQRRKAEEGKLHVQRLKMDKAKVCRQLISGVRLWEFIDVSEIAVAVKRYSYLLSQTKLFKHFVDIKVCTSRR
jgi:SWI/SNF-related matrix-associated actin-dependent regulator of chromatin subfamily A member 5